MTVHESDSNSTVPNAAENASIGAAGEISTPVVPESVAGVNMSAKWLATIQPLVARLGMTTEEVTRAILAEKLVKAADDSSADALVDPDAIGDQDFVDAFPDATKGDLRKAVKDMREAAKPAVASPPPIATATQPNAAMLQGLPQVPQAGQYVIPDIPEGEGLLAALSASKTLTIDDVTIRAALEAFHADSMNLSDVPETLVGLMEHHADEIEEPVGEAFTEVYQFVRARRYAEVNVDSKLVTKERKKLFMGRIQALPFAVQQFHATLSAWNEMLRANRNSNPLGVLSGVNVYPPPDEVIAASEGVVGCLKIVFAGFGVQVARALAYESIKIRETIERPELPALTGSANRELMLKALGCKLTNADVRLEKNIAKYVLFVATIVPTKLPGGQEGSALEALYNLGQIIQPWMNGAMRPMSNGSPRRDGGRRNSNDPFPIGSNNRD